MVELELEQVVRLLQLRLLSFQIHESKQQQQITSLSGFQMITWVKKSVDCAKKMAIPIKFALITAKPALYDLRYLWF